MGVGWLISIVDSSLKYFPKDLDMSSAAFDLHSEKPGIHAIKDRHAFQFAPELAILLPASLPVLHNGKTVFCSQALIETRQKQ